MSIITLPNRLQGAVGSEEPRGHRRAGRRVGPAGQSPPDAVPHPALLWENLTPSTGSVGVEPPPPPGDWPALPNEGERLAPAWACLDVLEVVPGTSLTAQPAQGLSCVGADRSAVSDTLTSAMLRPELSI
jgi:hypothetical protein